MSNPREVCTQSWGPGPLEDYLKLSGQVDCDPIEAFAIFIKRNVDTDLQGHLLDTDDNDGEFMRRIIDRISSPMHQP